MKVVDNLYAYLWPGVTMADMMRYGNNANSYLIADGASGGVKPRHILIDPGQMTNESGMNCLERLTKEIDKDGFNLADIGLVILTHGHPDHCLGARHFRDKHKAQVAIGEGESAMLKAVMPGFQPDIWLKEGDFNPGAVKLQVINTPGHSPGGIAIYWSDKKALFVGDVIFQKNTGRTDLPGGSGKLLQQSIKKLAALDVEYLLTGHQYQSAGMIKGVKEIKANFDFIIENVFPYLA